MLLTICPSRILAKITDGQIDIKYLKAHNHKCDFKNLKHCHLLKSDIKTIQEKLKICGKAMENGIRWVNVGHV